MRSLRNILGLAVLATATSLFAQPAAPVPGEDAEVEAIKVEEKLTPEQMAGRVKTLVEAASADVRLVTALQLSARKEKDSVKLTCINDKLIQIKALRNMIDRSQGIFGGAGTPEEQSGAYVEVRAAASNIHQLREQAQQCGGEPELSVEASNGFDGPDIPDDPSQDLFPEGVEPPAYASPFN